MQRSKYAHWSSTKMVPSGVEREAAHHPAWVKTEIQQASKSAGAPIAKSADVVIAGGHGTVRALGEGLRGSGIPLALYPP